MSDDLGDSAGQGDGASPWLQEVPPPSADLPVGTDTIASPGGPGRRLTTPRRHLGLRLVPVAVLAVLALLAGGAVAVSQALSGGGRQPESLVPASAYAFVKVDLDPAAGQKVSAYRLIHRFPQAARLSDTDLRDRLVRAVATAAHLDYDRDVRPWLGSRVGLAVFPGVAGRPEVLGVLQVKSADAAKAALARIAARPGGTLGWSVHDGYAVLARTQPVLDAAEASARTGSLGASRHWVSDVHALGGHQVAMAWVDLPPALRAAAQQSAVAGGSGGSSSSGQGSASGSSDGMTYSGSYQPLSAAAGSAGVVQATRQDSGTPLLPGLSLPGSAPTRGRLVLGVHATGDAFELDARVLDAPATAQAPDAVPALRALPADTVAGLAADTGAFTSTPSGSAELTTLLRAAGSELDRLGVTADQVRALVGSRAVVALGGVPGAGRPLLLGGRVTTSDPAAAQAAAQAVADSADGSGGPRVDVRRSGSDVVLGTGDGFADRLLHPAPGGGLSGRSGFGAALGSVPAHTLVAGYVDVRAITAALAHDGTRVSPALVPVSAVGLTVSTDAHGPLLRLRVVVH